MNKENRKIEFAPLQGFTESVYRELHAKYFGGVDNYYTPFVRIERGDFRNRDMRDILPENNILSKTIPQMIASTPDELNRIADKFCSLGYTHADLNMGCPFPLIANKHKGAGLLPFAEEVKTLLEAVNHRTDLTFSLKIRLGWDSAEQGLALMDLINATTLSQLTIHARLGKQQYKGEVDKDAFALFYEKCKHPLLYNGDIKTPQEIDQILERFPKLSGVMIGRGLLENPALAWEWKNNSIISEKEKKEKIKNLHEELVGFYESSLQGEHQILAKLQAVWEYLYPEGEKKLRKKILKSGKLQNYKQAVHELLR
ncbi:MAG: tRNA-dihydrouridine synthase family protein [Bacteroidales bacterium]